MELRASGKIVLGIVTALGTIGGLHLLVFKKAAQEYQAAEASYNGAASNYRANAASQNVDEIAKFRFETLAFRKTYYELLRDLRVTFPEVYTYTSQFNEVACQTDIWNFLTTLIQLRAEGEKGNGPKLTFLGENGWRLTDSLPANIVQRGIAIEDEVTKLSNQARLLKGLDPKSPVGQQVARTLDNIKRGIGIDSGLIQRISDNFGPFSGLIATLNRLDLIMKALPEEHWGAKKDPQERLKEMYALLEVKWPYDGLVQRYLTAKRQGDALLDIIQVSKEVGIVDIVGVKMLDTRLLTWEAEKKPAALAGGTAGPGAPAPGGFSDDMPGSGGRGRETPEIKGEIVGSGAPIEIVVRGSNAAVMALIYRLTHERRPYEVDRIMMRKPVLNDENVQAQLFINVVYTTLASGVMTDSELNANIVTTTRDMADQALKPGAREVALKAGIITMKGSAPELVASTPTAAPTPVPTPTPQ